MWKGRVPSPYPAPPVKQEAQISEVGDQEKMINGIVQIRPARVADVPAIKKLIDAFAGTDSLLPRTLAEIYSKVRDFWVAEDPTSGIIGCVALQVVWEDLAEVRSLAVDVRHQSCGVGRRLVLAVVEEAKRLGLPKVFALTNVPGFFKKLGFREIPKETLPHKVWTDCVRCPKFLHCDETALILQTVPVSVDSLLAKDEPHGLQSRCSS